MNKQGLRQVERLNRIYEILRNNTDFDGKLKYDDAANRLTIVFHEYLRLDYIEGNDTAVTGEGLILLNDDLTHWHIQEDEEALEIVTAIAGGDDVFIERHKLRRNVKLMDKEKFAKKRERYMRRKSLRIYTGTKIIKRDG